MGDLHTRARLTSQLTTHSDPAGIREGRRFAARCVIRPCPRRGPRHRHLPAGLTDAQGAQICRDLLTWSKVAYNQDMPHPQIRPELR